MPHLARVCLPTCVYELFHNLYINSRAKIMHKSYDIIHLYKVLIYMYDMYMYMSDVCAEAQACSLATN